MARLLACPFCRELFLTDEGVEVCPDCDLPLRPLHSLAPSADEGDATPGLAWDVRLPWWYWRKGRAALMALALTGIALFFMPWIELTKPESAMISGFSLAQYSTPWLWGGPVAWFITIPLLVTRRTVRQLWGARLIAFVFATLALANVALLAIVPASSSALVPVEFEFTRLFWLSGITSLVAMAIALRLGGGIREALAAVDSKSASEIGAQRGDATLH